jgi:hypothetical protein
MRKKWKRKTGLSKANNFLPDGKVGFRGIQSKFGFYGSKTTGQIFERKKLKQIIAIFVSVIKFIQILI